jgi:hypothetical protein
MWIIIGTNKRKEGSRICRVMLDSNRYGIENGRVDGLNQQEALLAREVPQVIKSF